MIKISIIMPLFNAEKYLRESLESILGQSFTDFELICINDASTDGTMEILKDFQRKDDRICIISNKECKGAALSRNRGIDIAEGRYLSFLDGDDVFDENMLEVAYHTIEGENADVVLYEYQHVSTEFIYHKLKKFHSREYVDRYCTKTFSVQQCESYEIINWGLGPCNKLYRKSFIKEKQLIFQDLPCANDIYFVSMALMLSEKIIVVDDERVMLYARDHFEAGRISSNRDAMCNYKALLKIGQELIKRDKLDALYESYYYRVFFSLKDGIMADKNKDRAKLFYSFLQKEGIDNLCAVGEKYINVLDKYLYKSLLNFKEKSFESEWYKEENILKFCLYTKADKVINMFGRFKQDGKKVAMWGAGDNGSTLADFCQYHGVMLEAIIDKSVEKQGNLLSGYRIVPPQEVLEEIQVIIISARAIYREVMREIEGKEIEVIDINSFFRLI